MSELESFTMQWNYPASIRVGVGRIKELPDVCLELGIKAPLLVTDPGLKALPMLQNALISCHESGLECHLFSDIKGNPTGENVEAGVAAFKQGNHDGVIAIGGGSALDAAKAIALMVGQDRPIWDFEDVGDNWKRVKREGVFPVIAVPTTAGTGSEVGRASVITHAQKHVKKIIFHPDMMPQVIILDPELTTGLPGNITAATGLDALSHNLEAYCSPFFHPMAEGIAVEGIRLVKENLPLAYVEGSNLVARTHMLVASTMGATAFQKGLGAMHALAHPLGALYDVHHGLLNAVLMPYVLKMNQSVIEQRISRLSLYLELPGQGFGAFFDWVIQLRSDLGIPHTLSELGIGENDAAKVGLMAFEDPSAAGNPLPLSVEQYQSLFCSAVRGDL
ncbi:iron-containing alcohol dehydrogenase [Endozoicomonas numazuensis]|uniref:Alcohol dehydrogenase n=1 Tax=Endozoicomonas numazuensis TaxID=1137799 RepID=A0A081N173_9GAMM|nr:iron-containing alcohol dehydrogenase [Endozoicomonas numazuensis]KEQ12196.1 alcohol dehydrogenase [Endozoicomonas numazuensis]